MDSKEVRSLMEAYSEVYAPQEVDEATAMAKRGYDEAPIRQKIAKSTGGGKSADRATALENQPTYGNSKKAKQRQDLARKQRGDFRKTTSSSPGLHGYGHKSDDPKVKAKQAARGAQRGALTPAEKKQFNREEFDIFDVVLEFLQAEGYAETLEEAEWMMANLIDEEAISIITELTGGKGHPGYKAGSKDHGPMQSGHSADTFKRTMKGGTMSQRHGDHLGDLDDKDDDEDDLEAGLKDSARKRRENVRKPLRNKVKAARKVLSKEEYVDEAQHARENPEKYEREQAKKSAPVRGERTPMPPRGDKRREDFEKWYAANVR